MRKFAGKVFLIIALSALGITLAITEDFSFLNDKFQWQDFATMAGPTGTEYSFCWTVHPCTDCVQPYNIQFRKYRVEGGQEYMSDLLHVSQWKLQLTEADGSKRYCANDSVAMSGHWVYEARMCGPNPDPLGEPICLLASSTDPTYAKVQVDATTAVPRAWWVYTFLAAPGTPEVDMKWWNKPHDNRDENFVPSIDKPKEVLANVVNN